MADTTFVLREWLRHLDDGADDQTAVAAFAEASFLTGVEDPESAWALIAAGIQQARTDRAVELIGASSLENFLSHTGELYLPRLAAELARSLRWRLALAHVWRDRMSQGLWQQVQQLQQRYPAPN